MNTQNFPKWFLDKIQGLDIINLEKIFLPEYLETRVKKIDDLINDSKKIADYFIDNNVFEKEFFPDGVDIQVESSFKELRVCFKSKINENKRSLYRHDIYRGKASGNEILPYFLLLEEYELEWEFERARRWIIFYTLVDLRKKKKISKERFVELLNLGSLKVDSDNVVRFGGIGFTLDGESCETYQGLDHLSPRQQEILEKKLQEINWKDLMSHGHPRRAGRLRDYIDLDNSIEELI